MRVLELKALARDRGLRNYSRMRKAELVALLQNNGTPERSRALQAHPPPSRSGGPRAPTPHTRPPHLNGPPSPPPTQTWEPIDDRRPRKPTKQEMDIFEQREMSKSRPQVKSKLNKWCDWLINHVPKPIKDGQVKGLKLLRIRLWGCITGLLVPLVMKRELKNLNHLIQ